MSSSHCSKTCFRLFICLLFSWFWKIWQIFLFWMGVCMSEFLYSVLLFGRLCTVLTVCNPNIKGAPDLYCLYLRASVPHIFSVVIHAKVKSVIHIWSCCLPFFSMCSIPNNFIYASCGSVCGSVSNSRVVTVEWVQCECFEYLFLVPYLQQRVN
jgi:hypothetical protein